MEGGGTLGKASQGLDFKSKSLGHFVLVTKWGVAWDAFFTQNLNNEHLDKNVDFDNGDGDGNREVC